MSMSSPSPEFRFFHKTGEYDNRPAQPFHPRRSKIKIVREGKICPSCGMKRSVQNKCFCNED